MAWYDFFAHTYDASLEPLYAEHRALAADALELKPGMRVLDAPCGTGQSFAALSSRLGPEGTLIGADLSAGMLRKAEKRQVDTQLELHNVDAALLEIDAVDAVHVFLGMTVFDDMQATFEQLWRHLKPGGRCILVDVHAETLGLQGWMVNKMAQADIRRRFWEPLQKVGDDFRREDLPYNWSHGGQIQLAVATKPR